MGSTKTKHLHWKNSRNQSREKTIHDNVKTSVLTQKSERTRNSSEKYHFFLLTCRQSGASSMRQQQAREILFVE